MDRAWSDLQQTATNSHVWRALAFADIRSKYRFSTLGTLWITLSTGIMSVSIGLIYGQFFGQDVSTYLPYFTAGMIFWTFMASVANEATQSLIQSGTWIKGSSLPISFYIMRMLQRNFIILLHNLIILVLVWLWFRWPLTLGALMAIAGLVLVYMSLIGVSVVIAFACVRYRDIPPMIGALTQFVFFASPILWHAENLKFGRLLLTLNPITYLIEVVRDPLLGKPVSLETWLISFMLAVLSLVAAALVYARYRNRIAYWV